MPTPRVNDLAVAAALLRSPEHLVAPHTETSAVVDVVAARVSMDDDVPAGEAGPAPAATGCRADRVFRALALASLYILSRRWRAGGAGLGERPSPAEIAAAVALCASVARLYALPVLGIRRTGGICHQRWHQD